MSLLGKIIRNVEEVITSHLPHEKRFIAAEWNLSFEKESINPWQKENPP